MKRILITCLLLLYLYIPPNLVKHLVIPSLENEKKYLFRHGLDFAILNVREIIAVSFVFMAVFHPQRE